MKKKIIPVLIVISLIIILTGAMVGTTLIQKYTPTKERETLSDFYQMSDSDQVPIILNREVSENYGRMINDSVYLSYSFVRSTLNSRLYWNKNDKELYFSTAEKLYTFLPDSKEASVEQAGGASPLQLASSQESFDHAVCTLVGDELYISLDFILPYSDCTCSRSSDPNRLVINTTSAEVEVASVKKDTEIRHKGGIKSPILAEITAGTPVTVLAVDEKWTKILTEDGIPGYVMSDLITGNALDQIAIDHKEEDFTHNLMDKPIVMGWHQVTNRTANNSLSSVLSTNHNMNVISPTWFYLNDNEGGIADNGSQDYVSTCHAAGIEVWGLVSNLEDASVSTLKVLTHRESRRNLEKNLIQKAINYNLDGINVDFESLDAEIGDAFIQFIRELSFYCDQNKLRLSVDNYVPFPYTSFYNRHDQACFADYVIIMGYDEHYNGSDAGSVASLGWVRDGVEKTLLEAPAEQTILGIPFYTRIWDLETSDSGEHTTKSSAIYGIEGAAKAVLKAGAVIKWNEEAGQNYAEWEEGKILHQVWLEDSTSIGLKMDVARDNGLAGVSFWKLGFENSEVWNVIRSK